MIFFNFYRKKHTSKNELCAKVSEIKSDSATGQC